VKIIIIIIIIIVNNMLVSGRIKKKILDNVVKNLIALFQENDKREMCIYIYILNITVISKYRYELCYRLNKKKNL
jgi:hypothetical protein